VLAATVHVYGEGDVAQFGEHAGAALFIVGKAPPLVYHEHAVAFAVQRVVVGEIAGKCFVLDLIRMSCMRTSV